MIKEAIYTEWKSPKTTPPTKSSKILVITTDGPEIVTVYNANYMEYANGDSADPSEWEMWADFPYPESV